MTSPIKNVRKHRPIQQVHASELHLMVKPWPFRGQTIDLIGHIHPTSSKGNK